MPNSSERVYSHRLLLETPTQAMQAFRRATRQVVAATPRTFTPNQSEQRGDWARKASLREFPDLKLTPNQCGQVRILVIQVSPRFTSQSIYGEAVGIPRAGTFEYGGIDLELRKPLKSATETGTKLPHTRA
jgi:hypothetical protein